MGQNASQNAASRSRPKAAPRSRRRKLPEALPGFWTLPRELQHRMLALACSSPVLPRTHIVGRSDECTDMMMRLTLSCRAFNSFATSLLYAHVRLTRPSDLRLFHQALASRPALGMLVKSLHIGPEETQPEHWWPIDDDGVCGFSNRGFLVHLEDLPERARHKWWAFHARYLPLQDSLGWGVDDFGLSESVFKAVTEAIRDGSRDLNVDVRDWTCHNDPTGRNIGSDAWHTRGLELQAALELYCLDMYRRDELEKQRTGAESLTSLKTTYPRLAIRSGSSASTAGEEEADEETFVVTRHQLYQRMTRRGAPTDNFNHPLLFARSGLKWLAEDDTGYEHEGQAPRGEIDQDEDIARAFAWPPAASNPEAIQAHPGDFSNPIDLAIPGTLTVGGNVSLARLVLALTPEVSRLSMTGFLECALLNACPPLRALRSVMLGPQPNGWDLSYQRQFNALRGVEKLRICGRVPSPSEIKELVEGESFGKLRKLQWSMTERITWGSAEQLMPVIKQLVGLNQEKVPEKETETAGETLKRSRSAYEGETEEVASQASSPSGGERPQHKMLSIEVRLHAHDVEEIYKSAKSGAIAAAWRTGEVVAGQRHRLKFDGHAELERRGGCEGGVNEKTKPMFEEGRKFWEEDSG